MDVTHYLPFAWEYSIWNATVTALQFWTTDLKPHILCSAIEWVYTVFFHSTSAQQLQNLLEEILFSRFVTNLKDTFEIELAQEDEGYESRSESLNIATPLRRAPWICHMSISENLSFHPTTPLTTAEQHPVHSPQKFRCNSPVCCHLVFSSSDEESPVKPNDPHLWYSSTPDSSPVCREAEPPLPVQHHVNHHHTSPPSIDQFFQEDTTKETFPTTPIDDDVWLEDQTPDRQLILRIACQQPVPKTFWTLKISLVTQIIANSQHDLHKFILFDSL